MNSSTQSQQLLASGRTAIRYGLPLLVLLAADLAAAQEQLPIENAVDIAALPRDLTPLGMFMQADMIVKAVMIGLAVASVLTWTVWFAKTIELMVAKRRMRCDLELMAAWQMDALRRILRHKSVMSRFLDAATAELELSHGDSAKDGIKERIALSLERIEKGAARRIARGTGVLATIGATAPFVGLFGTVWGIMNSFIGISKSQTTNLAVVAPGIAEALLATAFGLVAAIPAVVIYNTFARQIGCYRELIGDASTEILKWVSRELDVPRKDRTGIRRERSLSVAE